MFGKEISIANLALRNFVLVILAGWSIIGWLNLILVQIEDYVVGKVSFLSYKFTHATWVGGGAGREKRS